MFTRLVASPLTQPLPLPLRIALVMLLVLAIVGLVWTLRKPARRQRIWFWSRRFRWNRRRTQAVVALTLACLLITSPPGLALATHTLTNQIPADSGAKADAIVVLGRGTRFMYDRSAITAALWQGKRAPRIFVSGRGDAIWLAAQLLDNGIPSTAIEGENCSLTTEENAQFTAETLLPQGMKQIILVTDAPHMLRSRLTFESLGFQVIAHPSTLPADLSYRENIELVVREYAGILSYVLRGRFHERETTEAV